MRRQLRIDDRTMGISWIVPPQAERNDVFLTCHGVEADQARCQHKRRLMVLADLGKPLGRLVVLNHQRGAPGLHGLGIIASDIVGDDE